ncbi:hypothetical protein WOLCODRAFT_158736 [Wolfiporia cocos MD-104 SS10]|uniref:Fungal-type protein kinase domain-containing protein n=1 Tax=Wolfiporia cocos (strain MD-104) TaxID=742152 RepID=A0A2H3JAG6_WOLCO|nr:hypothetical protein WOLCODRAFT_158736 [Wolfiporia cocos MD-104 SS10]
MSTKELVQVMRDTIKGHLRASLAGVPHRDVSDGNIIIIRDPRKKHTGFLDDFDYSCLVESQHYVDADGNRGSPISDEDLKMVDELKRGLKERTGTPQFVSVALPQVRSVDSNVESIESEPIEHAVCHDLDRALAMDGWPENDKAIPFPPPTLRQKPNEPSDGTLNLGSSGKQKGSMRENGQSSLPTTVEASTHDGAYDGTKKGLDLPHLRSISGPSGTAAEPSASEAESTKRRKRNWSEILPAQE